MKNQKGFTLVELIVVIGVLALLAVGAMIAYGGIQRNARRSQRTTDATALVKSLNLFNANVDPSTVITSSRLASLDNAITSYVSDAPGGGLSANSVWIGKASLAGVNTVMHILRTKSGMEFDVDMPHTGRLNEISQYITFFGSSNNPRWEVNTASIAVSP